MSNRNTDSLLMLAEAVQQQAPVLKRYLPPCGVALAFANGAVITASGIPINTVMEAGAVQRALYQFLQAYPGIQPQITAAAAVGAAGENACTLADLLSLAAYSDKDTLFCYRRNDGTIATLADVRGRFSHLPHATPELRGTEGGGYTVRLVGTARTHTGEHADLGSLIYPDFQLTSAPDPTDLTPVRALIADLYERFDSWTIAEIALTNTDGSFPLSGRDLQVLRRALPDTTPVLWNGVRETLASLMPGAYQSNFTSFASEQPQDIWQDVAATALETRLGAAVFRQAVADVIAFAATAPVQPPRVAGVVLADATVVCASHVPLHGLNVPSCAESHALRRALSQEQHSSIRALVLLMHENHTDTPLLGIEAAPCGFCRTCIAAVCDADVPIILTDGAGRFQWAAAGSLLKYHRPVQQNPVSMAAAETGDGHCLSVTALRSGYHDCDYPPAIGPEMAYRDAAARRLLLYTRDAAAAEQVGAYARHWLAKAADNNTAVAIEFDTPCGPLPDPLRVDTLFGALPGFDFAANGRFVDSRALHLQHHTIITGADVGR